jgi:hypothetical protein
MQKRRPAPDRALMLDRLDYRPDTGVFVWKKRGGGTGHVGSVAGCVTRNGYRVISVGNVLYMAHRLAWLYIHGEWPAQDIDHINGDRSDNRLVNLRLADRSSNNENRRAARSDSRTGLLGAQPTASGTYFASIRTRGQYRYLGTFATAQEAHNAYIAAKRIHHEGNTL